MIRRDGGNVGIGIRHVTGLHRLVIEAQRPPAGLLDHGDEPGQIL